MIAKLEKPNYSNDGAILTRIKEVAPNKYAAHVKFRSAEEAFKRQAENVVSAYLTLKDVNFSIDYDSTKFSKDCTILVIFTTI